MTKCYHFNQGYCKEKENCMFVHIIQECPTNCKIITCELRHIKKCRDRIVCFYYQNNICEFSHDGENNVSSEIDQLKNDIEILKQQFKETQITFDRQIQSNNKVVEKLKDEILVLKNENIRLTISEKEPMKIKMKQDKN